MEESGESMSVSGGCEEEAVEEVEWCAWVDHAGSQAQKHLSEEEYVSSLEKVFFSRSWDSFQQLWSQHSMNDRVTHETSVRVFRAEAVPLWEHPIHAEGGKWLLSFVGATRDEAVDKFMVLVKAMVMGQLGRADAVLGCVLTHRPYGASMTLWNRDAKASKQISKVKKKLRALFDLPKIKYQVHRATVEINRYSRSTGAPPPAEYTASLNKGARSSSNSRSSRSSRSSSESNSNRSSSRSSGWSPRASAGEPRATSPEPAAPARLSPRKFSADLASRKSETPKTSPPSIPSSRRSSPSNPI